MENHYIPKKGDLVIYESKEIGPYLAKVEEVHLGYVMIRPEKYTKSLLKKTSTQSFEMVRKDTITFTPGMEEKLKSARYFAYDALAHAERALNAAGASLTLVEKFVIKDAIIHQIINSVSSRLL